jgi:hypothetical protein
MTFARCSRTFSHALRLGNTQPANGVAVDRFGDQFDLNGLDPPMWRVKSTASSRCAWMVGTHLRTAT